MCDVQTLEVANCTGILKLNIISYNENPQSEIFSRCNK